MRTRLTPERIRARFVECATAKFAGNVPDFVRLRKLVDDNGGRFLNDHGAIRTADPRLRDLFIRAAQVLGLHREREYAFPDKHLLSCDLQVIGEDAEQFKIFVSQVDLEAFPSDVWRLIEEDCAQQAAHVDHAPFVTLIERFEAHGALDAADADAFVDHFVHRLMQRNGPPMSRSTLEAVAAVSGEAASALALGPDFNHVTIDVRAAGFDSIEAMATTMQSLGMRMLPQIQGAPGSMLRQTATLAASIATPVLEADGRSGSARTEKQFVEIIERGQATDADGHPLWRQDGRPLIYRNFLSANAARIFDAAATRTVR
ncbi:MAG: DUF1338 family protein [Nevskiales bacterium]|nr:DUF1338 family protein [Nevskiales bacterium]